MLQLHLSLLHLTDVPSFRSTSHSPLNHLKTWSSNTDASEKEGNGTLTHPTSHIARLLIVSLLVVDYLFSTVFVDKLTYDDFHILRTQIHILLNIFLMLKNGRAEVH